MEEINSNYSVVLVDDNETDNLVNRRIMELTGFAKDIKVFSEAQLALDEMNKIIDGNGSLPDFLFLDINMPVINGFAFLEKLLERWKSEISKLNIVVLTSSDSPRDMERLHHLAVNAKYITKPLSLNILQALHLSFSEKIR